MLFQGTRHHPLTSFETEPEARRQTGQSLQLWRVELIQHERDSLDSSRTVGGSISPDPANLPRLPPWAAPNGWDYRGCPWAYLDAASGHREVVVSSTLSPPSTWVTKAVLVDCPHEPQFLPDMVVAQSASVAAGRATRQVRPFTQKGEIWSRSQPPWWQEGPCVKRGSSLKSVRSRRTYHLRQPPSSCSLVTTAIVIVLPSWNNSRRGRLSGCSTLGDVKTLLCPEGMLHRQGVPEPSFTVRHLRHYQGALS